MDTDVAMCYGPYEVGLARQPLEDLLPGQVLVKVGYCGVCPWDLRVYSGLSSSVRYPLQLGHEVGGVVEAVGQEVQDLRPGDRVAVDVIRRCGVCAACRRGLENHCANADYSRGGFAHWLVVPAANVYRLRESTPLVEAALTEPLACIVRAQNRINIKPGSTALVTGAGPLGLLHLQLLRHRGASVIVSDLAENRLEVARLLGAKATVNPAATDLAQVVAAETDGFGVEAAIIATGRLEAANQALPALSVTGSLLLFAGIYPKQELRLDPNLIHYRELFITGSADYTPAEFGQALQLIEDKAVQIAPLISHVYPLAEIGQALATLAAGAGLKITVRCNELEPFEPRGYL